MSTELERVRQEVEECFYRGRVDDGRKELADFERLVREDERRELMQSVKPSVGYDSNPDNVHDQPRER